MPKDSETYSPLWSCHETADRLNVSHWTVRKLARELGAIRVGGQLRFRPESIEAYLDAHAESEAYEGDVEEPEADEKPDTAEKKQEPPP